MKKMKKLLSMLIAATMTLAMTAPSFAANSDVATPDSGFTLTINDPVDSHTYEVYQIFEGKLAINGEYTGTNENADDRYILSDIEWGKGVDQEKVNFNTVFPKSAAEVAADITTETKAEEFAKEISSYLVDTNTIPPVEKNNWTPAVMEGEEVKTPAHYTVSGLQPGYYLVRQTGIGNGSSEVQSAYILKLVANRTATPKRTDGPGFEKNIKGSTNKATADYAIGDNVPFELKATMPEDFGQYDSYPLTFTDEFSSGLTYNGDVKIYLNNSTEPLNNDSNISINYNGELNDEGNRVLTVDIKDAKLISGLTANGVIRIEYSAAINLNAEKVDPTTNEATLSFPNNPNVGGSGSKGSKDDKIELFIFGLDLTKIIKDTTTGLNGAKFKITRVKDGQTQVATVDNNKITGWISYKADDAEGDLPILANAGTELESKTIEGKDGKILVDGFAKDTYKLVETQAPAGYNKLAAPVEFTISATAGKNSEGTKMVVTSLNATYKLESATGNGDNAIVNETKTTISFSIANSRGTTLPSTGGIGTTIFYAAGIILMAGAVFFVVRRKKA